MTDNQQTHKCLQCEFETNDFINFSDHNLIYHSNVFTNDLYVCDYCEEGFPSADALDQHVDFAHPDEYDDGDDNDNMDNNNDNMDNNNDNMDNNNKVDYGNKVKLSFQSFYLNCSNNPVMRLVVNMPAIIPPITSISDNKKMSSWNLPIDDDDDDDDDDGEIPQLSSLIESQSDDKKISSSNSPINTQFDNETAEIDSPFESQSTIGVDLSLSNSSNNDIPKNDSPVNHNTKKQQIIDKLVKLINKKPKTESADPIISSNESTDDENNKSTLTQSYDSTDDENNEPKKKPFLKKSISTQSCESIDDDNTMKIEKYCGKCKQTFPFNTFNNHQCVDKYTLQVKQILDVVNNRIASNQKVNIKQIIREVLNLNNMVAMKSFKKHIYIISDEIRSYCKSSYKILDRTKKVFRKYQCPLCNASYNMINNLNSHFNSVHVTFEEQLLLSRMSRKISFIGFDTLYYFNVIAQPKKSMKTYMMNCLICERAFSIIKYNNNKLNYLKFLNKLTDDDVLFADTMSDTEVDIIKKSPKNENIKSYDHINSDNYVYPFMMTCCDALVCHHCIKSYYTMDDMTEIICAFCKKNHNDLINEENYPISNIDQFNDESWTQWWLKNDKIKILSNNQT